MIAIIDRLADGIAPALADERIDLMGFGRFGPLAAGFRNPALEIGDCLGKIFGRRRVDRAGEDGARLRLHAAAVARRSDAQAGANLVGQIADGQDGHDKG
jgi:hypothetical protein